MLLNLLSRFWIFVVKSLRHLPIGARSALADVLALLFWIAIPQLRRVTLTNLRLCFPQKSEAERRALARRFYRNLMRAALDHGVLWSGTRDEVAAMVRFEGVENITETVARGEHLIVIAPHFVGLDAAGIGLNLHVRGCSLYQKQANPVWDEAALAGRMRFAEPELIAKSGHQDLKAVIRAMRKGLPFYYLPDMDHGRKNSIFVPFFGVPAATIPMAGRLAKVTGAKVCLCIAEMTRTGYTVHISEPWQNYPTGDVEADTRRITEELEKWIERLPTQYLWSHRRFKTRPEGEPSVYGD